MSNIHEGLKISGQLDKLSPELIEFYVYNALDAAVTREIQEVQQREITTFGVQSVIDHEMSLVEPLMAMTWRGIKQDVALRESLKTKLEMEIANLQIFLDKAAGGPVNVKSPKQMLDLLYTRLGLPAKYKRGTSRLTADKDAVNALAGKFSHPVLSVILEIRQRRDFVERYLDAQIDSDGRMRCSFDITGTRSGRLSSRQSIYGSGTNLQNIPSRKPEGEAIRRTFIADEGMVFIYRDLSQAEARVVAYLAECQGLIELFEDPNRDIHRENAARIFNKHISEVTDEERYLAKKVVHACVDDQTEVLTPSGWKSIKEITQANLIMQWEPTTHKMTFIQSTLVHKYEYSGQMIHFNGPAHDQLVTPNHKMPYMTNDNDKSIRADNVPLSGRIPINGSYSGRFNINPILIRLAVAIQADGSYTGKRVVFHLKRERKIIRLVELLTILNIEYKKAEHPDGSTTIRFNDNKSFSGWLDNKQLSWSMLNLSSTCLDAIIDEALFWDGSVDTNNRVRYEYASSIQQNIDVFQTICHLRSHGSKTDVRTRCMVASVNNREYARIESVSYEDFDGYVYCLTTNSGFFLIRRNGHISVTGNSNYGMGPDKLVIVVNEDFRTTGIRIDEGQARKLIEKYFMIYPEVRENWWKKVESDLRHTRTLNTPFGRKRMFFGRWEDKLIREGYSYEPQSTIGWVCCEGLVRCYHQIQKKGKGELLLQVHDSILMQCKADDVEGVAGMMAECMNIPMTIHGRTFTIPTDAKVGLNWGMRPKKNPEVNPNGLVDIVVWLDEHKSAVI